MPDTSNRKEPKRKFALWIRESTLDKVRKIYKSDNCSSQSEFIEKAILFYTGYLSAEENKSYLSSIVISTLKGIVAESDNRQNRMLFKLSVEMAMMMNVVASMQDIRWRDMLRTQTQVLASNLKIPMENLRWYAAFHNESHHLHVHLLAYSVIENEGYLTKQGVHNLRSSFANDIFAQDLLCTYEKQTGHRDSLRKKSREILREIIGKINTGIYDNPTMEQQLIKLADRLSRTGGKKVYGYLKADVKAIVDSIVEELAEDERIAALYDLWYEQREEVLRNYTQEMPKRFPLSQNKEFKSIKNAVIQEAMNLAADKEIPEEPEETEAEKRAEDEMPQEEKRLNWNTCLIQRF